MTSWATMKHRTRGPKTITLASPDDEVNLKPAYPTGPPVTGTTVGPELMSVTGPDGHALFWWEWPSDPEAMADAERQAARRRMRIVRGGRV